MLASLVRATKSAAVVAAVAGAILFVVFLLFSLMQSTKVTESQESKTTADLASAALREAREDLKEPEPKSYGTQARQARQRETTEHPKRVDTGNEPSLECRRPSPENSSASENDKEAENRGAANLNEDEAEPFLRHMEEHVRIQEKELRTRTRAVGTQGRVVFAALLTAGLMTFVLVVVGIVLVAMNQLTHGVVLECAALLPGSGILILWLQSRILGRRRANIANELSSHVRTLQAIQLVRTVPNPDKRSDAMVDLAGKLVTQTYETSDAG